MANELQVNISAQLTNGSLFDNVRLENIPVTQSVKALWSDVVDVTTSEADVAPSASITTLGYCYIKNVDPTNYITYGPKSGGSMVALGRLKAGESCIFRLEPGITLRWIANTGTCKAIIKIYAN